MPTTKPKLQPAAEAPAAEAANGIPMPTSTADTRRLVARLHVDMVVQELKRECEFRKEQARTDYSAAFRNYSFALWRWACWRSTPPDVIDKLNGLNPARFDLPDTPESWASVSFAQHDYMLASAFYLRPKGETRLPG